MRSLLITNTGDMVNSSRIVKLTQPAVSISVRNGSTSLKRKDLKFRQRRNLYFYGRPLFPVCYQEGAREVISDLRTESFISRISDWAHSGSIRIPVSFLIRIYPRALNHGSPDLIENGVRLLSELYGAREYFLDFPTTVFTKISWL